MRPPSVLISTSKLPLMIVIGVPTINVMPMAMPNSHRHAEITRGQAIVDITPDTRITPNRKNGSSVRLNELDLVARNSVVTGR